MADTTSLAYDAVLSTTLYNFMPKLENNVFQSRPMLNWLKSKNRIRTKSGGERIVVPIVDGTNSTAATYSMYDGLDTTPQDGITAAEYRWRQAAVSVAIAGLEEAQNDGKEAIIDLLEAKTDQATEALSDLLLQNFLSTQVGASGTGWNGIAGLVDSTGTVGGLDPTVHTNWVSYESDSAVPLTIAAIQAGWNGTSQGGTDVPDFILTGQTLFEKYESLLQPQLRFSDPGTADAGFDNLLYKGAPVCWDYAVGHAASGFTQDTTPWYFLNSKHLFIVKHAKKWFSPTPFKTPVDGDARYSQIICYGNLVTNCRRRLGKLTSRTA